MNITPIEIRQKEFERHFRGYDKDEVNAFLHTLSQAWERVLQENREKTIRLEQAEKDIKKVREVEGSLFRTLRTAEDTSSEIVSKAERMAEEKIRQAEQRQQEIIDQAHQRAQEIAEAADRKAGELIYDLQARVDQLKQEAEEAESRRQYALAQLQELADRMLQQVANAQPSSADEVAEETQRNLEALAASQKLAEEPADEQTDPLSGEEEREEAALDEEHNEASVYEPVWASEEEPAEVTPAPTSARLKRGSFFDELE